MLDTSRVTERLAAARAFADAHGLRENLDRQLAILDGFGGQERTTRCTLFHDFAPHSFTFNLEVQARDGTWRRWFNGGLIYHGSVDGHGSGSFPTLAVTLEPTTGWSIHT